MPTNTHKWLFYNVFCIQLYYVCINNDLLCFVRRPMAYYKRILLELV